MTTEIDYLATGTVITMDPQRRIIKDGAVAVSGQQIAAVGKRELLQQHYQARQTLGGPRDIIIPGLIDCHNHLAQALVREMGMEDLPNIYRLYIPCEIAMSPDDALASSHIMLSQLLRAGVTTVAETTCTPAHEDTIAQALLDSGIRAVMARGQGDRKTRFASNYDQVEGTTSYSDDAGLLEEDLARSEDFIKTWQAKGKGRLNPWIHTGGLPACSDERFLRTKELAQRYNAGVMTHINRDREEIEISMALHGERPLEHLHKIGALWPGYVAIHAMLTTDREIQMLAETGAKVAHSPMACIDIISAVTKVVSMRACGVTVGLGCDTLINDILKVMRIAFIMHTQSSGIPLYDPVALSSEDILAMATCDGAKVLGLEDQIGSLETGKQADLVVINGDNVYLSPQHNPVGVLVQYASGGDVKSVLVDGQLVVNQNKVLTIDEALAIEEAAKLSERLRPILEARRYQPMLRQYCSC